MKANLNETNDLMTRMGTSKVKAQANRVKRAKELFKNDETAKSATLDFIFGKSETNPLA